MIKLLLKFNFYLRVYCICFGKQKCQGTGHVLALKTSVALLLLFHSTVWWELQIQDLMFTDSQEKTNKHTTWGLECWGLLYTPENATAEMKEKKKMIFLMERN